MLDLQLEGKRALVTGSSSGIGEAIARTLARQGVAVVVHGRDAGRTQRVADAIDDEGGKAAMALGDLSRQDEADRVASRALEVFGGIDILVDNAGRLGRDVGWLDSTVEEWEALFEANLFSAVRMIRALVPGMRDRGWGRVIQIASIAAVQPRSSGPAYGATKAAMVNASVSLARELAGTGVTVNSVSPGPIETPMLEHLLHDATKSGDGRARVPRIATTVGRLGKPEEVAALVAFLASPLAGFIDATDVSIDGGRRDVDLAPAPAEARA